MHTLHKTHVPLQSLPPLVAGQSSLMVDSPSQQLSGCQSLCLYQMMSSLVVPHPLNVSLRVMLLINLTIINLHHCLHTYRSKCTPSILPKSHTPLGSANDSKSDDSLVNLVPTCTLLPLLENGVLVFVFPLLRVIFVCHTNNPYHGGCR